LSDPGRAAPSHDRGAAAALAAVLVVALALRLWLWTNRRGALWFEEDVPVAWAWRLWGFGGHGFDPNPHSALWPHFSIYIAFAVQMVQYAAGRLTGTFTGPADFRAAALLDPAFLRGPAMLAWIAIGVATIAASGELARRLAGAWAGVAVAVVLAVDPLFARYSLAVSPDMPLTLCSVLGLLACLDVAERGSWRDSLAGGVWLGLGAACKYTPILLALPMVLAHARRPAGRHGIGVLADGRLWGAAGVSLAAFALTSPFTLVDLASRWAQFGLGASVLVHQPGGGVRHFAITTFAAHTLPRDLGWPLLVLLALAAVLVFARRDLRASIPLAYALAVIAAFGLVPTPFGRYLLPALPALLAAAAAALAAAWAQPARRVWVGFAATAALVGLAFPAAAALREQRLADSRALAHDWFLTHVPAGSTIALEYLGPELPDRAATTALLTHDPPSARWRERLRTQPSYYVSLQPLSFPAPAYSTPFYVPALDSGFDCIVTSSGVGDRYRADPVRFPVQCAFYAEMERSAPVAYRTPATVRLGPTIVVYRLDAAARTALARAWSVEPPAVTGAVPPLLGMNEARTFTQRASVLAAGGALSAAEDSWREALLWRRAPASWWRNAAATAALAGDTARARTWTLEAARR
jgi:hypothetical protein